MDWLLSIGKRVFGLAVLTSVACATGCLAAPVTLELGALPEDLALIVPAVGKLPADAPTGAVVLRTGEGAEGLSAQAVSAPGGEGTDLCLLLPPGDRGATGKRLRMEPSQEAAAFQFSEDKERGILHLLENDQPVLDYCFGMQLKEGVPADRRRACYAHPIYGLDGEVITDDFPKDHYHHRGLFWGWPYMERDGKAFSIWDIRNVEQRVDKWVSQEVGPVCAQFETAGGWYVNEERIADEQVCFRVWRTGVFGRALDLYLRWTALDKPILIRGQKQENKGYGGPNLRFAPRPDRTTIITTPDGRLQGDGVYVSHPWTDLSAPFHGADRTSGAAVFCNAANPRFPDAWLLRHYGILCLCWPGREEVAFEPGKPVEMRYRVWVHRGDAEAGRVAQAYGVYAEPPVVRLVDAP